MCRSENRYGAIPLYKKTFVVYKPCMGMHSRRISPNKKSEKFKEIGGNTQNFRCDAYYSVAKLRNNK